LLEALAGTEPEGFKDALGETFEALYPKDARRALEFFDIFVSEDAIPPEVIAPPKAQVRRAIQKLDLLRPEGLIEPFVGFRPPFCGNPPSHSATMGYVFSVVAQLAEPPPP
jgi:hypothetical protein